MWSAALGSPVSRADHRAHLCRCRERRLVHGTDEQLEIVDEDDHLVGLGTRQQIHADRLWHRGSYVTLTDPDGKVLLTRRSATKANDPGRLEASIGEHVAPRETYLEAAQRGLKEELGVEGGTHEEVRILRVDLRRGSETAPSSACLVQIVGMFSFVYDGTIRPDPRRSARSFGSLRTSSIGGSSMNRRHSLLNVLN